VAVDHLLHCLQVLLQLGVLHLEPGDFGLEQVDLLLVGGVDVPGLQVQGDQVLEHIRSAGIFSRMDNRTVAGGSHFTIAGI